MGEPLRAILGDVDDLDLAMRMADLADDITQAAFSSKTFTIHVKDDGTPVTDADIAVEEALVRLLDSHRPVDSVLSEELGARGRSRRTWIIDGIDGTACFSRGGSTWGTLIALRVDDEVMVGVATSPGLGRGWWAARGAGAWAVPLPATSNDEDSQRLAVSRTDVDSPQSVIPASDKLTGWRQRLASMPGTATGSSTEPLNFANGTLGGTVVLYGGPWDHAPFVVLVEEAGGRFSHLWGSRRLHTRTAIYSNGDLHEHLRARARRIAPHTPERHDEYE